MKRKYNPWVRLAALLMLFVILLTSCTGCAFLSDRHPGSRFTLAHQYMDGSVRGCYIITDTETGVQYLYYKCGLTALLDGEE